MSAGRNPWICKQCLRRLSRQSRFSPSRSQARYASTQSAQRETASTVSPALLSRARASEQECATLNLKIAENFDTRSAKRIGELTPIISALSQYDKASESLSELRTLLKDPSSDAELRSLASEDLTTATSQLSSASQKLTEALVPQHPFANLPCLIEIRPGIGGSEAGLFAAELLRMYRAFCDNMGLNNTLLKQETDDAADSSGSTALTEGVLEVDFNGAYEILRCEAGVHRVQRVPATEAKGRTHTSAASVLVLPSLPTNENNATELDFDDPNSDYYINPSDVRTDIMRARGAGGQHVNTTDSAVRLTHLPSGTVVAIQDSRSQQKNRQKAWQILRAKLAQAKREAREEEMLALRRKAAGGVGKTGRSDKVRTYNWGQQRVTDHRSGFSVSGQLDDVMEGGQSLKNIMESVKSWMMDREVDGMLAEEESENSMNGKTSRS